MSVVTVTDLHLVEDPDARLLRAAILAGVKAGSDVHRILVRVPDRATDGVRAYRVDDVARMLQRHGRIREIGVTGSGTIVAAADVCRRRGEVAIWTGQAIGKWAPSDITERGLGGSETAAVRLAENLAAMGFLVTLYGDFEQPGLAGDIILRKHTQFDESRRLDVLIGFRDARLFDHRPNARFCALWLEDLAPAEMLTPARAKNIDRICAVSGWHRGQVLAAHRWLSPKLVAACRNGIQRGWFTDGEAPERESRVLYTSSPDRGGDIVLEVWPQVRERVPDAELILTYPRWIDICAQHFKAAHDHMERLRGLLEQPGVHRIEGGLGQKALSHLMRASLVWTAPSYYSPAEVRFEETSCISAMEAQAAGLVVVASNWGALQETVAHGTLLDGDPSQVDGPWRQMFVDAIVQGLTDEATQSQAQQLGPEMVRGMGWRGAAEQLAAMFPAQSREYRSEPEDFEVGETHMLAGALWE